MIDTLIKTPVNGTSLVVAPTIQMLNDAPLKTFLQITKASNILQYFNKVEKLAILNGNRTILFRSADDPERLRGGNISHVWLDEMALMHEQTWEIVLPTLREFPGTALGTTTPRGKSNWVYKLWNQSNNDDYAMITSKSSDNPYLPDHFIDTLKRTLTTAMYKQEIEGLFIDNIGSLFKQHWFTVVNEAPSNIKWYRYWDLAASTKTSADFTASVRVGIHNKTVYIDSGIRIKAEWPDARKVIINTALAEGSNTKVGIEEALHGLAAVQELKREEQLFGIHIEGIRVEKDKQTRAMLWASKAEAGIIKLVNGSWIKDYMDEITSFPKSSHDDYVDATSGAYAMLAKPNIEWTFF